MKVTSYSNFRKKLKNYLDSVSDDHEPIIISRKNTEDLIVISKSDYNSLDETAYLTKSLANADALKKSIQQIASNETKSFTLEELKLKT